MMIRDQTKGSGSEGWHYDHWFITPSQRKPRPPARPIGLALVCLVLMVGSIVRSDAAGMTGFSGSGMGGPLTFDT